MKLNTKRCQELMNEQCVSLKDIERMTGITVSSLSWIFENRYLEVSTLERIADTLKCDANDIASFDDYNGENVIEFLKDGNWKEVDCKYSSVPEAVLPDAINQYVKTNYAGQKVLKIEKEDRGGYEIKLSGGLELGFDKRFQLIDIDN